VTTAPAQTVVTTAPGETVVTTVPSAVVTTVQSTPAAPTSAAGTGDPVSLNNDAWQDIQNGNYRAALPLLQQAVRDLQGGTSLTTAYANYNLGITLIALGRCSDAIPYLNVAKQIEPGRHEVHDALKAARRCGG
jgi:TolA-binding protein